MTPWLVLGGLLAVALTPTVAGWRGIKGHLEDMCNYAKRIRESE